MLPNHRICTTTCAKGKNKHAQPHMHTLRTHTHVACMHRHTHTQHTHAQHTHSMHRNHNLVPNRYTHTHTAHTHSTHKEHTQRTHTVVKCVQYMTKKLCIYFSCRIVNKAPTPCIQVINSTSHNECKWVQLISTILTLSSTSHSF